MSPMVLMGLFTNAGEQGGVVWCGYYHLSRVSSFPDFLPLTRDFASTTAQYSASTPLQTAGSSQVNRVRLITTQVKKINGFTPSQTCVAHTHIHSNTHTHYSVLLKGVHTGDTTEACCPPLARKQSYLNTTAHCHCTLYSRYLTPNIF